MLKINLYKNNNSSSRTYGMIYPRVEHDAQIMDIPELAEHIANHGSVYTEDVVLGVMNKMARCIKELVLEGKKIRLADLVIIKAAVKGKGKDSYLEYNLATDIKQCRLSVQATGKASIQELTKEAKYAYTSLAESLREAERPEPEPEPEP